MFMATARATGVTDIFFQLIISSLLLVVLAIPFGYQMHASGNGKGVLFAFLLWTGVGLINFAGLLTSWPVKLTIANKKQDLLQLHSEMQPEEIRPLGRQYGLIEVQEARKLHNGNTWFVTGGHPGGSTGLLYSPDNNPTGFNQWSCYQISDKWYLIEED
jgi:hypothetical protein